MADKTTCIAGKLERAAARWHPSHLTLALLARLIALRPGIAALGI